MHIQLLPSLSSKLFALGGTGQQLKFAPDSALVMGDAVNLELGLSNAVSMDPGISYDGLPFPGYMLAGALAGVSEHVAMFPVDTVKTRMQAAARPGQQHYAAWGVPGLYRGAPAVIMGAGPAHALYFAAYENVKELTGANKPGHHPLAAAVAGTAAVVMHDGFMTPWDVTKQRMQVAQTPYRSVLSCAASIAQKEGLGAFYRSYRTTVLMNLPHTCIYFPSYESLKKLFSEGDAEEEGLAVQLVAGGGAGGLAAALTTPFDVVKTRLQLEGMEGSARYGTTAVVPVLRQIVQQEGPAALWRGWLPRVLFHAPAAAVCWGTYETIKKLLA